jgi:hypothetical protein
MLSSQTVLYTVLRVLNREIQALPIQDTLVSAEEK